MDLKHKVMVVTGVVLVMMALIMAFHVPVYIETPHNTIPIANVDVTPTKDVTIYKPAVGTEDFVFGSKDWEPVGTNTYNGDYGTLWKAEDGEWVVITMRGQIISSGWGTLPSTP